MNTRFHFFLILVLNLSILAPAKAFSSSRGKMLLNVPLYRQTTDYTCGPASLKMVLAYYGHHGDKEVDEMTLAKELGANPKTGTESTKIAEYARQNGLAATIKSNQSIEDLAKWVEQEQLAIVELQAWNDKLPNPPYASLWDDGHDMVVIGIDDKNVYFADPSLLGSRGFIPIKEFEERWHDLGEKNEKLQHTVIYFKGTPQSPQPWEKVL